METTRSEKLIATRQNFKQSDYLHGGFFYPAVIAQK